jgi:hypothetical protein
LSAEPRHLLAAQSGWCDLDHLDLVGHLRGLQNNCKGASRQCVEREGDVFAGDNWKLMQHHQGVAEKRFGLPIVGAVGGEEVVQVQSQRWVIDSGLAVGAE